MLDKVPSEWIHPFHREIHKLQPLEKHLEFLGEMVEIQILFNVDIGLFKTIKYYVDNEPIGEYSWRAFRNGHLIATSYGDIHHLKQILNSKQGRR